MKKIMDRGIAVVLCMVLLSGLAACRNKTKKETAEQPETITSIYMYTLNHDRDCISRTVQEISGKENLEMLILRQMMKLNSDLFPEKTELLSVTKDGSSVTVDFSSEIQEIDQQTFLFINELCAISLTQGDTEHRISEVNLLSDGQQLDGFFQYPYRVHLVDYFTEENLKLAVLKLYFPDQNGEKLHPEYRLVPLVYPLDQTVICELLAGTEDYTNKTNVIPLGTKLIDCSNTGSTYTVNLNLSFLQNRQPETMTNLLAIQSFVASLTEFNGIDRVKFLVEGETKGVFFGDISLDEPIERNVELLAD